MGPLEQVFLYVTKRCNASCANCYAEPISATRGGGDIGFDAACDLIQRFRTIGASKLTFLGGEPTLHARLFELASFAKNRGYRVVRINTNGMWPARLRSTPEKLRLLDIVSFSIDGSTAPVNDTIRKGCRLDITLANMRLAVTTGCEVRVNSTIRRETIQDVIPLVKLAEEHGARKIYLNLELQKHGERTIVAVDPDEWADVRARVLALASRFSIEIEIAAGFSTEAELGYHRQLGHRCLAADGSRKYANEQGEVWPCLLFLNDRQWIEDGRRFDERSSIPSETLHQRCHFLSSSDSSQKPLCIYHRIGVNAVCASSLTASSPEAVFSEK